MGAATHGRVKKLFQHHHFTASAQVYHLKFTYPFRLAHGTRTGTDLVFLRLSYQGIEGYGEASLPPYLPFGVDDVVNSLSALPWEAIAEMDLQPALEFVLPLLVQCPPAMAAFDMALHDMHARRQRLPLYAFLGLPSPAGVATTYTIGMSTPEELPLKLEAAKAFKLIKLKLGGLNDLELINHFTTSAQLPFCVDINQGWQSRDLAASLSEHLERKGALFIEQPFPKGREEDAAWLADRCALPIIADESIQTMQDIRTFRDCFAGVNVKLMKSGGLRSALAWMNESRKLGLSVVLGAMAESSCGVSAAAHISTLADTIDLDGPMLSANDPFTGLRYQGGLLSLPDEAGVGAHPRKSW